MKKMVIGMTAALAVGGLVFAQNAAIETTAPAAAETVQETVDIASALAETENVQKFGNAVAVAQIDVSSIALDGVTVFAPVDTAVTDPNTIINVEDYIVPGKITAEILAEANTLITLSGKELTVESQDGTYLINGIAVNNTIEDGNVVINTLNGVFADTSLSLLF